MGKNYKLLITTILWSISISFVYAGPDNIASQAKVTASSSLSTGYQPFMVIDDHIRIFNKNEWVSNSKMTFWGQIDYPWIQLRIVISRKLR